MDDVVTIETGTLAGARERALLHFRGIPYAQAARFEPPTRAAPWVGTRDASRHGPICPQPDAPFDAITGPQTPAEQDENCLTLSVVSGDTNAPLRPVMVWIHGGAYFLGSSSSEWYRGDALVEEGDVVLVRINYRLGVFGYLQAEGIAPGNLGVLDQVAALQWVQRNIARFGGDPTRVTVFGESAGGHSVLTLMSTSETRGLFQRAIVQSAHLGVGLTTRKNAARVARVFVEALRGVDPRSASTGQLLAAQKVAMSAFAGPFELNSTPAFGPIAGAAPLPASADLVSSPPATQPEVALLIGSNRDEAQFFIAMNPLGAPFYRLPLLSRLIRFIGGLFTKQIFVKPLQALARAHASAGGKVYSYDFAWLPPALAFGVCHGLELPFVFGGQAAWEKAPMLGGARWEDVDRLGREMRRAWTGFAHGGDPNLESESSWVAHASGIALARQFR